jgi:hypothetical protein
MNILFYFLVVSSVPFSTVSKECKMLPNGNYKMVQYANSIKREARVKLKNSQMLHIAGKDSIESKLIWVYDCMFKVEDLTTPKSRLTGIDSLLLRSFSEPCYELQRKNGDTTFFRTTYRANLRITTSSGMFIRLL